MLHPRECLYCGKRFIGKTNRANFCCDSHRQMYYRNGKNPRKGTTPVTNPVIPVAPKVTPKGKETACLTCGEVFRKKRSTNNFCTPSCRIIYNNTLKTGKKNKISLTKLNITCEYCGDFFETYKNNERFCCAAHLNRFSSAGYRKNDVIKDQTFDDVIFDDTISNEKVVYANCEFINCNFESTMWDQARFVNCMFTDCFFYNVKLFGVKFLDCGFYGTNDFTSATVRHVTIKPEPNHANFIRDSWIM